MYFINIAASKTSEGKAGELEYLKILYPNVDNIWPRTWRTKLEPFAISYTAGCWIGNICSQIPKRYREYEQFTIPVPLKWNRSWNQFRRKEEFLTNTCIHMYFYVISLQFKWRGKILLSKRIIFVETLNVDFEQMCVLEHHLPFPLYYELRVNAWFNWFTSLIILTLDANRVLFYYCRGSWFFFQSWKCKLSKRNSRISNYWEL